MVLHRLLKNTIFGEVRLWPEWLDLVHIPLNKLQKLVKHSLVFASFDKGGVLDEEAVVLLPILLLILRPGQPLLFIEFEEQPQIFAILLSSISLVLYLIALLLGYPMVFVDALDYCG